MLELTTPAQAAAWLRTQVTGTLHADSRKVGRGDGFIAWPGFVGDGRKHVPQALAQGAAACVVEAAGMDAFAFDASQPIAAYAQLRAAAPLIAAEYFEHPSDTLQVLAVTGTNGKTTTAWWLAQALSNLQGEHAMPCGLIGTLGTGRPPNVEFTGLTTPDPVLMQRQFRAFLDDGLAACAIEASSIGIEEQRMDGTRVRVAIFTNFTQDHLDYHGTMDAYWAAKLRLFRWPGLQAAVVNLDDEKGVELENLLKTAHLDLWTVSCVRDARLRALDIGYGALGLRFTIAEAAECHLLETQLVGQYNVANLLGVVAAMRAVGVPLAHAVAACRDLLPVPGRMERINEPGRPLVAVDYAHTPDALDKALQALRPLAKQRGGELWCVFGCGGDRDPVKRPLMAAVAEKNSDHVVVTSDNPRNEKPEAIISQILLGLSHNECVKVQGDRGLAIAETVAAAAPADVILIAGKGHEDYQEVAGVKLAFSDQQHARAALAAKHLPGAAAPAHHGQAADAATASMFTLQQAAAWIGGRVVGDGSVAVHRVHSDSRTLQPGDLFVALRGERFDANDFIAHAQGQGAVAALAHADRIPPGFHGIEVDDTKIALGMLARAWRRQFSLPLIAVTGSNGKTTVTQMIASILRASEPDASLATQGNFNNDIGLPLTLLRLRAAHRIGVLELGMNHPGEIGYLAGIALPTVAMVNNAQREHQEFMATIEAVARENGSVFGALDAGGVAVFPAGDAFTPLWTQLADGRKCITFGEARSGAAPAGIVLAGAEWQDGHWAVRAETPVGPVSYRLHIAGRHNVRNSLAAVACAVAAGVPLAAVTQGLERFEPVKGRSRAMGIALQGQVITLVDDTYNANPDSARAAIDVLAELPAPQLLVLGDMGEVGSQGPQFHAEVGDYARERGIALLFTLGEQSAAMRGTHFGDVDALNAAVLQAMPGVRSVLVKGSRFMKMERVVDAVTAFAAGEGASA